MEFVRGLHNLKSEHLGCVATIGNFDGVHLGHQQVLVNLRRRAREMGLPSVVVIFEPQPLEFLAGSEAPFRLTRLREKLRFLSDCEIDRVVCLRFDRNLLEMHPLDFVKYLLLNRLGVRYFLI